MRQPAVQGEFPATDHDHAACVAVALRRAEAICAARGTRLTRRRRAVLEILWESHSPVGAYAILERMNAGAARLAPISVYRALEFLMRQGFVHRLASINTYAGCGWPGAPHSAQFLICSVCGTVAELHDEKIGDAIVSAARDARFEVDAPIVEIQGLCPRCRKGARAT
ncbi:MAG: Fur family transcriptional regulator [bacterium]|nr:Fur family transcriptional regulator [bacterium]